MGFLWAAIQNQVGSPKRLGEMLISRPKENGGEAGPSNQPPAHMTQGPPDLNKAQSEFVQSGRRKSRHQAFSGSGHSRQQAHSAHPAFREADFPPLVSDREKRQAREYYDLHMVFSQSGRILFEHTSLV
ncbi:hypothetical protein L1987_78742 [Smallanthus sonchifolius]|uniref:Uncharacterized protein n=1 Tax=Smallanthus sonchifolius TaxID=185202 RepID=A0ACB8ZDS0_9ASTR|nr:hypothetical protein L1987_78742 [Smallanthus sonchifolius]